MLDVGRPKLPKEKKKNKFVHVPVDEQTREDFAIACSLRGDTMAGLLHRRIAEVIREEKERDPAAFEREDVARKIYVRVEPEKKRRTA